MAKKPSKPNLASARAAWAARLAANGVYSAPKIERVASYSGLCSQVVGKPCACVGLVFEFESWRDFKDCEPLKMVDAVDPERWMSSTWSWPVSQGHFDWPTSLWLPYWVTRSEPARTECERSRHWCGLVQITDTGPVWSVRLRILPDEVLKPALIKAEIELRLRKVDQAFGGEGGAPAQP